MNQQTELTHKEKLVIDKFESLRKGFGELAKQRILSEYSGWREIIQEMGEEEITVVHDQAANTIQLGN